MLTPEFWTVELLFNRSEQKVDKLELLTVLLEEEWTILKQFVDQQRQLHDQSEARRQKFLLDYLKTGSQSAALLMLKTAWDFAVKKLDDGQAIRILQLTPVHLPEGERLAKEILRSPRGTNVRQEAARWLYADREETMPKEWNYEAALNRFVPEKMRMVFNKETSADILATLRLLPHLPCNIPIANMWCKKEILYGKLPVVMG